MNFKRNCFVITLITLLSTLLSSCGKTFEAYKFIEEKTFINEDMIYDEGKYVRYKEFAPYEAKTTSGSKTLGSSTEIFRNNSGRKVLSSLGLNKILVVPVEFNDYKISDAGVSKTKYIRDLNDAFFGIHKNNKFVSVSQYFNESSYGKLQLSGKVCDSIYTFSKNSAEIENMSSGDIRSEIIRAEYPKILKWYEDNYADLDAYSIPELYHGETIENRRDIPLYLVYTCPPKESETSNNFFWAYTYSDYPVSVTSFASLASQFSEPDAHTLIHETGHLFGLPDYYPTASDGDDNDNKKMIEPTARIDMMDCSVGDESGLSKMMLNWTTPYQVKDSTTIPLKPFVNNGDLILINDNWNKTPFDEYYLIEFYTPTRLNCYDSKVGNSEAILPSLPGIKIYHVNSRLAYFNIRGIFSSYCDDGLSSPNGTNIGLAHNNYTYKNPSNVSQKNYLYELILNTTENNIKGCAKDGNLFHAGDVIDDLKLSSGESLNYKISINYTTFKEASITLEKIA